MENKIVSTRILPGLKSEYAIVALPKWAWIWIDDYVMKCYDNNFDHFIFDTRRVLNNNDSALEPFLSTLAQDLRDYQLRSRHFLANDNAPSKQQEVNENRRQKWGNRKYPSSLKFPTIFQLFRFIAHATDMKTLWQRRNYDQYS